MSKYKLNHNEHKAAVVTVDMGYGHQRAAYPLKDLAYGKILSANNYAGIPDADRKIWRRSREFYEFISRFKNVPIVGEAAFDLYDKLQEIPSFYPRRDLSKANFEVEKIYDYIEKNSWGKHLIQKISKNNGGRPLITTFFIPAFMAEVFDYPGEIYAVICDADISRAWAPKNPATSRINYFAPCYRVVERLKLYGVRSERIFLTGFPLPIENIGGEDLSVLKHDLTTRLLNLDPDGKYTDKYYDSIRLHLGDIYTEKLPKHPLTATFAVGGAGAQREVGAIIANSLKKHILRKKIRLNLVAGIHNDIGVYFRKELRRAGLYEELGRGVNIIFASNKDAYFRRFNAALRTTDILWTKPSELSFYSALGLPIIMAPPIGSQEKFNRIWLKTVGAGISQEDPRYTNEWLFDWINSGWLAEAAMNGFLEAPKYGLFNIYKVMSKRADEQRAEEMVSTY
ncbi:MAG: hypothetical protein AAB731_03570 [Patescibacteria group bacterium]